MASNYYLDSNLLRISVSVLHSYIVPVVLVLYSAANHYGAPVLYSRGIEGGGLFKIVK